MNINLPHQRNNPDRSAGYSLVSIMVVVGIMGTLVTLSMPFDNRAKMITKINIKSQLQMVQYHLKMIADYEYFYKEKHSTFASMPKVGWAGPKTCLSPKNAIRFRLRPCDKSVFYTYEVLLGANADTFTARATSGKDKFVRGCDILDVWTIDQDKKLTHVSNTMTDCPMR